MVSGVLDGLWTITVDLKWHNSIPSQGVANDTCTAAEDPLRGGCQMICLHGTGQQSKVRRVQRGLHDQMHGAMDRSTPVQQHQIGTAGKGRGVAVAMPGLEACQVVEPALPLRGFRVKLKSQLQQLRGPANLPHLLNFCSMHLCHALAAWWQ